MDNRQPESPPKKRACVIGGSGYVGSMLVKLLLQKGYAVNTSLRDAADHKISHLVSLQDLGDLKIFEADLCNEKSLIAPIECCDLVFHVASPVNFSSKDPENDMIKPAIEGVHNVLKACAKAKTVTRVILTSSAAAVTINKLSGTGLIVNEENWTDMDFLNSEKPPTWGYAASKLLAEKEAWKSAKEDNIDLITVLPSLLVGPSLTPNVPSSVNLAMSLITGNDHLVGSLVGMQMLSGSISITHVEDACRAHIFLAEKQSSSGRYVCCGFNTSVHDLSEFLRKRYPQYQIPSKFGDLPCKPKLSLSSKKLIDEGFIFNHGIEDIFDETVEFLKCKGVLN